MTPLKKHTLSSRFAKTSFAPTLCAGESGGFVYFPHTIRGPRPAMTPNPSLKRTRTGMPFQAVISFSAFHVLPALAA